MSRLSSKSNQARRIFRLHTFTLMHTMPTQTHTRVTKATSATATSQGLAEKISSTVVSPVGQGTSGFSLVAAGSCSAFRVGHGGSHVCPLSGTPPCVYFDQPTWDPPCQPLKSL